MTREERNTKLKHFITCLKCEVSGKECDDNCPVQYEAGNMGEIIENLEAISKALEQEPCDELDFVQPHKKVSVNLEICKMREATQEEREGINQYIDSIAEPCPDAISREKTCDYIAEFINHEYSTQSECEMVEAMIDGIQHLPPVKPQYTEDEIQKMQDLEQAEIEKAYELGKAEGQESDDAISRQAAIDALGEKPLAWVEGEYELGLQNQWKNDVDVIKTLLPAQPKTGHWNCGDDMFEYAICSSCKHETGEAWEYAKRNFKYCPNCGAKMVESQESEG